MYEFFLVFLASMSPIFELRGSIPLGILYFNLSPVLVFIISVLGNFLIVPVLLIFLNKFSDFLMRKSYFFNKLLNWVFARTRAHHAHKFEKYEHWALFVLVAIPLPLTGVWTGSVATFLFGVPFKRSLQIIFGGLMVAGVIVTALSVFGNGFLLK